MTTPTDAKSLTENAETHTLTATSRMYGESNLGTGQGYFTITDLKAVLDTLSGPPELFAYSDITLAVLSLSAAGTVTSPAGAEHLFGSGMGTIATATYFLNGGTTGNQVTSVAYSFTANTTTLTGATIFQIYSSTDSSFNIGNGGTIRFEIWSESSGEPGSLLANTPDIIGRTTDYNANTWDQTTAEAAYTSAVWSQYSEAGTRLSFFRRFDFTSPLVVSVGTKLFLRIVQTNGDPETHSVGLNRLTNRNKFSRTTIDPNLDAAFDWKVFYERSGVWTEDTNSVPIFTVWGTTDQGQGYYQASQSGDLGGEVNRCRNLDGTKRIRQVWNPNDNYTITNFGIYAGRTGAGAADMVVEIKQGGSTLHTAYLTGSSFPVFSATATIDDLIAECDRVSTSIPNIQVTSGSPVTFELSTTAGTNYEVISAQDGGYSGYFSTNSTLDGYLSFTDNGVDWTDSVFNDFFVDFLVQET